MFSELFFFFIIYIAMLEWVYGFSTGGSLFNFTFARGFEE